jgi:hypothetical protein
MTLADLNSHLDLVIELKKARAMLASMQGRVLGAQQLDGMPHGQGAARSTENLSILLETEIDNVNRLEQVVERSEREIRKWIDEIPDSRTRIIFNLRYLCGMGWQQVAEVIGGKNTENAVKSQCYRYLQSKDSL